jgi:hypothetical protein
MCWVAARAATCRKPVAPPQTSYASVIDSSVPIVVQHTRLDSRHPNIALMSTIGFHEA